ncbi:MAG: tRNA pseudouridine(55) synthase TruB [Acidobacteriota bacterium]
MEGSLIINKPEGWTSHDVVAKLRRILETRKIGHIGTLDPFATGVLVVCVGKATRLVQFLVGLDKSYEATVRLGFATDTQDLTGKPITPFQSSDALRTDEIKLALKEMIGIQMQIPPMFSAKKVEGVVLHKAARAGKTIERAPVKIEVFHMELMDEKIRNNPDGTREFDIFVRCSSGTYIRTLAHDLGEKLGTGAHLAALKRTAVGDFELQDSLTLDEVEARKRNGTLILKSPSETVSHLPEWVLDESAIPPLLNGREVVVPKEVLKNQWESGAEEIFIRACDKQNRLLAICEYDVEGEKIKPRVVLEQNQFAGG